MRLEDEIKTKNFESHVQKAHLNVLFTSGWILNRINHRLRPFDLTEPQYNVLRIVRGQRGKAIRPKDILKRMVDRHSNTTRIIDRLEDKGYLISSISDQDRRERMVMLTKAGHELLNDIERTWTIDGPHQGVLTPEEAATLNALLDKLRELEGH
jgi:DNA-binding MarR family transcriptional regulator